MNEDEGEAGRSGRAGRVGVEVVEGVVASFEEGHLQRMVGGKYRVPENARSYTSAVYIRMSGVIAQEPVSWSKQSPRVRTTKPSDIQEFQLSRMKPNEGH